MVEWKDTTYRAPAVTGTAAANGASCHPEAVSAVNVTSASSAPAAVHNRPE